MTMPIRTYRIESNGNIDPIIVIVDPIRPGSSRIIIQCYATAYTAYWGAHGADTTVEEFFVSCNDEYIVDNLLWGWGGRIKAKQEKFVRLHLTKIVQAVKERFKSEFEQEKTVCGKTYEQPFVISEANINETVSCFCVGPQPGQTKCPCMLRNES